MKRCNYVVSQNGMSHPVKKENEKEKYYFDDYFKWWRIILWAIKSTHITMTLKSVINYSKEGGIPYRLWHT